MIFFNRKKVLTQARIFLTQGLFDNGYYFLTAKRYYFWGLTRSSNDKGQYYGLMGAFLAEKGCYKKSILYLKKSIVTSLEEKSETLYYLVKSHYMLNLNQKVRYYFEQLLERSYTPFYIFLSYYEFIKNNEELSFSISDFTDLLPDNDGTPINQLTCVLYHLINRKIHDAYLLINKTIQFNPEVFFYRIVFLKILYKLRYYNKILDYFTEHISYMANIASLEIYSAVLYQLRLYPECFKVLSEQEEMEKSLVKPTICKSKIYLQTKKYTQAITSLKSALRKAKRDRNEIYFLLAIAHEHLGLLNDVAVYTMKIDPHSIFYHKAVFNLSLLSYDQGYYKNAKAYFNLVDENFIVSEKYIKWRHKILSAENESMTLRFLKKIIYISPWLIVFFSFVTFFFLMIIAHFTK